MILVSRVCVCGGGGTWGEGVGLGWEFGRWLPISLLESTIRYSDTDPKEHRHGGKAALPSSFNYHHKMPCVRHDAYEDIMGPELMSLASDVLPSFIFVIWGASDVTES